MVYCQLKVQFLKQMRGIFALSLDITYNFYVTRKIFALDSFQLIIKKDSFKLVRCDGYVTRN